jgi:hypothetical protein
VSFEVIPTHAETAAASLTVRVIRSPGGLPGLMVQPATCVSGPLLADTAPVRRDRSKFATDADWHAYLEREQEAAQIRGDTNLATLAPKELAKR